MNEIKAVLFDLDGTLLDTGELILKSFQHVYKVFFNQPITMKDVYQHFGKPLLPVLKELSPENYQEVLRAYREYSSKYHDQLVKPFPHAKQVLQELRKAGILTGIVTSKVKNTAIRGLKVCSLDSYFDVIVAVEDTERHKPEPEPVLKALEVLSVAPQHALMVGDSPYDLQCGRKAGVKTAAVGWSVFDEQELLLQYPDFYLKTLQDLLDICQLSGRRRGVG